MATRRERVVIELEDGLTAGVLREAAAVALLNRELDKLGRESTSAKRSMDPLSRETLPQATRNADSAGKSIDKLSGRIELFARGLAAVGPATIPIGAIAIPAVSTLASGLGFLAVGAGTTVLAFHGLGDALTKFNKAAAEPTATNIAAAQAAMDKIGPSAQEFVLELHKLGPELVRLQQAAGSGLFPGLTDGIREAQAALPAVERIFSRVGTEMGTLSAEAGKSLGGHEWAPFLKFIGDEAPHALSQLGHALGSVTHGLAELWMATQPLNSGGLDWIEAAAKGFDHWATGLDKTQGFQDFITYVQQTGPQVADTLKTIGDLFVDLVKDAAPLGGPTLQVLDDLLKVLDLIAASPLGTPLIALVQALSIARLSMTGLSKVSGATFGPAGQVSLKKYGDGIRGNIALWRELNATERSAYLTAEEASRRATARGSVLGSIGKGALAIGAIGVVSSGVTDKIGATNTAMDAMAGAMVGGVPGAVAGGLIGAVSDYKAAARDATSITDNLGHAIKAATGDIAAQQAAIDSAQTARDASLKKHQNLGYDLSHPFESLGGAISGLNGQTADQSTNAAIAAQRAQLDSLKTAYGDLFNKLHGPSVGPGGSSLVLTTQQLQTAATRAQPAMDALGITADDLASASARSDGSLDRLTGRLVDWTNTADSAKGRSQAMSDALNQLSDDSLTTADRVGALEDALDGLFNPKMTLNATHNAWHEALNGLKETLSDTEALKSAQISAHSAQITYNDAVKKYGEHSDKAHLAAERLAQAQQKVRDAAAGLSRAILGNSDAALKNQDAIRGLEGNLIDYLKAQAESGKPASQIMDTYRTQRQALIDTATQLGINKKDLEKYLKIIGFTPKAVSTLIELKGAAAAEKKLNWLTRDRIAQIRLNVSNDQGINVTGGHIARADGGSVPGPRRPYGDKVLAALAPGEEIISNRHGQADRFRADRASGRIPGYADGGTVARSYQRADPPSTRMPGMQSWSSRAPEIDYDRLTRALLAARPMYGDPQINGDPTSFRLQMQQDARAAAMGSVRP